MVKTLWHSIREKISIFGFSFQPIQMTQENLPQFKFVDLIDEGAKLTIHDLKLIQSK